MSTVTAIPVQRRPHGDTNSVRCAHCDKTIAPGVEFVFVEGARRHVFCAADQGLLASCTGCFMVPCQC